MANDQASTDANSVLVGTGAAEITLFHDFLCPACGQFEAIYGDEISEAVRIGALSVRYRPLNFLDRGSPSGTYSSRALQAFLAVGAQSSADVVQAFVQTMYRVQPQEGGDSELGDADIARVAASAGADVAVVDSIRDGRTGIDAATVADANSQYLEQAGSGGTPTVVYRGALVDIGDPRWLQQILS